MTLWLLRFLCSQECGFGWSQGNPLMCCKALICISLLTVSDDTRHKDGLHVGSLVAILPAGGRRQDTAKQVLSPFLILVAYRVRPLL